MSWVSKKKTSLKITGNKTSGVEGKCTIVSKNGSRKNQSLFFFFIYVPQLQLLKWNLGKKLGCLTTSMKYETWSASLEILIS